MELPCRGWQSRDEYISTKATVAVTAATSMASITWRQGRWMYLWPSRVGGLSGHQHTATGDRLGASWVGGPSGNQHTATGDRLGASWVGGPSGHQHTAMGDSGQGRECSTASLPDPRAVQQYP